MKRLVPEDDLDARRQDATTRALLRRDTSPCPCEARAEGGSARGSIVQAGRRVNAPNTKSPSGSAIVTAVALALAVGCASWNPAALRRFEFTEPHMGVPFRIVLYADNAALASHAARAAFGRVRQLNGVLSNYETDSELFQLSLTSGQDRAIAVSEDLWRVLERAQALAERTRGAFDVTIGPLAALWRKARRERQMPDAGLLDATRQRCGFRHLHLEAPSRTARLDKPGMRLDLGGIAKGYAADEAMKVLRAHGLSRALVSAAGDIVAGDSPPGQKGWTVALDTASTTNEVSGRQTILLCNEAVATSGDAFQFLEVDGVRYSHIVDPFTGLGLTQRVEVAVIAPDGMTADSLATAVSVLGPEAGLKLAESTPGVSVRILVGREGERKVLGTGRFTTPTE